MSILVRASAPDPRVGNFKQVEHYVKMPDLIPSSMPPPAPQHCYDAMHSLGEGGGHANDSEMQNGMGINYIGNKDPPPQLSEQLG